MGDLSTAFNTGLTVGAFTWGLLVDILGVRHLAWRDLDCFLMFESENGASTSHACLPQSLGSCSQVRHAWDRSISLFC